MRSIDPFTEVQWNKLARKYLGKQVRDTLNKVGEVVESYPFKGRINLLVQQEDGTLFTTDSDHATMLRIQRPTEPPTLNFASRLLDEDES